MPSLANFRLVGGTALSLLHGHRKSEDIDLFSYQDYGSINFNKIEIHLQDQFPYFVNDDHILNITQVNNNFGLHLHIGKDEKSSIKTDILNWAVADFIYPVQEVDGIRFATTKEIALMKLDAISRGGRKKDFWDMAEIFEHINFGELIKLYPTKYPHHRIEDVKSGMTNFEIADNMPDPICLRGKYWEHVKEEMRLTVAL